MSIDQAELDLQHRAQELVQREVQCCLSSLVSTLANSADVDSGGDVQTLIEQARELAAPVLDYEEAARQAGWRCVDDEPALEGVVKYPWRHTDAHSRAFQETAQAACELDGIDPYEWEVYEHWAVSSWLADKLAEHGEKVDRDFAGLNVWARTTTGAAISMDRVIRDIVRDLFKEG